MLVHLDYKPLLKIFTGHTNNEKCNTWGIEGTAPDVLKCSTLKERPKFLLTLCQDLEQ